MGVIINKKELVIHTKSGCKICYGADGVVSAYNPEGKLLYKITDEKMLIPPDGEVSDTLRSKGYEIKKREDDTLQYVLQYVKEKTS